MLAIRNLGVCAEQVAGRATAAAVMAGSTSLRPGSSKAAVTKWVRGAMDRLDGSLAKREAVMRACGHACAARHAAVAEAARRRREVASSLDDFLAEETRRFGGGVRYERRGQVIYHIYEPRSYKRPMRCYCGLTKGLKLGEQLSPTFCECSAGFVEATWEVILGQPVAVKLLESAVTGGGICRFEVRPRGRRGKAGKA